MDLRITTRLDALKTSISKYQTTTIRRLASGHSEEISYYRLLSNENLTEDYLCSSARKLCNSSIDNRHVLVLSDTTDYDYSSHRNRIKPNSGLGYIGNGGGLGYNAHVSLAVDADTESIYGLSDVYLWHRADKNTAYRRLTLAQSEFNKLKRKKKIEELNAVEEKRYKELSNFSVEIKGKNYTNTYHVPFEALESYRWLKSSKSNIATLNKASKVTLVQDREGDMYDTFVNISKSAANLLIRSKTNRNILTSNGEAEHLHCHRYQLTEVGQHNILVRDRNTGKERVARISIKTSSISLLKGTLKAKYQSAYPSSVPINVVYAEEVASSIPENQEGIFWCLLTTHDVDTLEQAIKITYWYSMRWLIETLFRVVKKSGFQLERSELETGYALRKLGILTMEAAVQVLQLKQSRDGDETLGINAVFTEHEVLCLETILPNWEGNTLIQKNPFSKQTLPWATWIIARIGGWNGYKNKRPPGVLCLRQGLLTFKNIYYGFQLANPRTCV